MANYISLLQWTEQGVKNFGDSVDRVANAKQAIEKLGGKLGHIYWTLGPYDVVAITEFPDDETATAFALKLSSLGNVRSTTMRAFDEGEFRGVIAKAKG